MRNRLLPPAVLFVLTLPVFSRVLLSGDHLGHVEFALKMVQGRALPPHPLFHAVLLALSGGDNALVCPGMAVFLLAASVAVRAWLTILVLSANSDRAPLSPACLTLFCLVLALAMPLPNWWHGDPVIGQLAPNVWHNPTTVFSMPFGLGLFIAGSRLLKKLSPKNAVWVSLMVVLSLLAKPNYVLAYAPCFGMALISALARATRTHCLGGVLAAGLLLVVCIPAGAVLTCQYLILSHDTRILYAPLEVWNSYSRSVIGSVLVGITFPLAVVISYPNRANASQSLGLAWTTLATAVGTFACFAESAKRISDGNFGWGLIVANHILFVISLAFLLRQPRGMRQVFCLAVLGLHALSGIALLMGN